MEIILGNPKTKAEMYAQMAAELRRISEAGMDQTSLLANASALISLFLDRTNWVGFYLWKGDHLTLGPFQGKPAVVRIERGSGVCGTAVEQNRMQRVDDVHACCNHIACDLASASEIVAPIHANGMLFGVLDIDSPVPSRFDAEDEAGLACIALVLGELLESQADASRAS